MESAIASYIVIIFLTLNIIIVIITIYSNRSGFEDLRIDGIRRSVLSTHYPLPIYHLPSTIYPLPITHYSLLITHYSLPTHPSTHLPITQSQTSIWIE
ncbi:hypothetical protein C7B77_11100 [Chamaesiphon polymorphus CCALA 037]|uniref:Uncharacterized protein n=1 Tax=Chamaesiphon polymorphus CCALA 037 TaxID=2107692 RepID=A0A2T1GGC8_9CYAN|nr:hypothetical protein C7B77_11100 [Chamaesiphon polymorphus CCALA 037]